MVLLWKSKSMGIRNHDISLICSIVEKTKKKNIEQSMNIIMRRNTNHPMQNFHTDKPDGEWFKFSNKTLDGGEADNSRGRIDHNLPTFSKKELLPVRSKILFTFNILLLFILLLNVKCMARQFPNKNYYKHFNFLAHSV